MIFSLGIYQHVISIDTEMDFVSGRGRHPCKKWGFQALSQTGSVDENKYFEIVPRRPTLASSRWQPRHGHAVTLSYDPHPEALRFPAANGSGAHVYSEVWVLILALPLRL